MPLSELVATDWPDPPILVDRLLPAGSLVLFIARQKEGKSTLALQLAIDVALGDPFLGMYATKKSRVLYVDYENTPREVRKRTLDMLGPRNLADLDGFVYKAYDRAAHRDVGLIQTKEREQFVERVRRYKPDLLVIDPLRYAVVGRDSQGEKETMEIIDALMQLQAEHPSMAIMVVHHLKKSQSPDAEVSLAKDPPTWIEKVYGSQALLGHFEAIWGLQDSPDDGFTFATVPRTQSRVTLRLEKEPESTRFILSPPKAQTEIFTPKQRDMWNSLPQSFNWREITKRYPTKNSTLKRVIDSGMTNGLLIQNPATKTYSKVDVEDGPKPIPPSPNHPDVLGTFLELIEQARRSNPTVDSTEAGPVTPENLARLAWYGVKPRLDPASGRQRIFRGDLVQAVVADARRRGRKKSRPPFVCRIAAAYDDAGDPEILPAKELAQKLGHSVDDLLGKLKSAGLELETNAGEPTLKRSTIVEALVRNRFEGTKTVGAAGRSIESTD